LLLHVKFWFHLHETKFAFDTHDAIVEMKFEHILVPVPIHQMKIKENTKEESEKKCG
jgi:hypothetical protein